MKIKILFIIFFIVVVSCKPNQKEEKQLTLAQKIASAHGFDNWDRVSRIDFVFNVDRDSSHFERSWSWSPKSNDISLINGNDTISYNRSYLDSTSLAADRRFINDKFWLLVPFQLVWDEGTKISESTKSSGPISKREFNKISIQYSDNGGYTPGDTYHVFFDDNYIIREWIYQSSDTLKSPKSYTFENYQDFNGLKIATEHKKSEGNWNLNFTNIKVVLEE